MQSVNNKALIEELDKLVERLRVPSEVYNLLVSLYTQKTVKNEQMVGPYFFADDISLVVVCSVFDRRFI